MAVHDLFTTIWQINPFGDSVKFLEVEARKHKFAAALKSAYQAMKQGQSKIKGERPLYLFVAPEYYWNKGKNFAHFTEPEKNDLFLYLRNLSKEYPDLVLVPGSVQWTVPKGQYAGNTANTDIRNKNEIQFVAFNTTPVFRNGEDLLTYHKKFNDGMVDDFRMQPNLKAVFASGDGAGEQTFKTGGLEFGLEVCGDFNDGQLQKTLGERKIDVMVLIAATVNHNFAEGLMKVPVRPGGAFVHCDARAEKDKNGVWVLNPGRGWHGLPANGVTHLSFADLDNVRRVVGIPAPPVVYPNRVTVKTMQGFGANTEVSVTDVSVCQNTRGLKQFSVNLSRPGDLRIQTAVLANDSGSWKATLSRKLSFTKTVAVTNLTDSKGMMPTGIGNVSKIGPIMSKGNEGLWSYYVPVPDA